jgi:hypothetical protein
MKISTCSDLKVGGRGYSKDWRKALSKVDRAIDETLEHRKEWEPVWREFKELGIDGLLELNNRAILQRAGESYRDAYLRVIKEIRGIYENK